MKQPTSAVISFLMNCHLRGLTSTERLLVGHVHDTLEGLLSSFLCGSISIVPNEECLLFVSRSK